MRGKNDAFLYIFHGVGLTYRKPEMRIMHWVYFSYLQCVIFLKTKHLVYMYILYISFVWILILKNIYMYVNTCSRKLRITASSCILSVVEAPINGRFYQKFCSYLHRKRRYILWIDFCVTLNCTEVVWSIKLSLFIQCPIRTYVALFIRLFIIFFRWRKGIYNAICFTSKQVLPCFSF